MSMPDSSPASRRPGMPVWVWVALGCGCGGPLLTLPILAAILFPIFAQAREKARAISCLSNMKQQGLAMAMYVQDYDECFPPANGWMDRIEKYLGPAKSGRSFLRCPSIPDPDGYGYAMNRAFSGKALSKITSPETQIVLFESSDLSRNASADSVALATRHRVSGGPKGNIAYADGHAKALTPGETR